MLVLLDADTGKMITSNGREKVMKDPEGKDFPWPPPTLDALMTGKLLSKSGEVDFKTALEGKVRGLYFSAHWVGGHLKAAVRSLFGPVWLSASKNGG